MAHLVLTLVGDDRAGLVAAVADVISTHGGNWERSQLAELDGTFAGVVELWVPDERSDELGRALVALDGLLKITTHAAHGDGAHAWPQLRANVLGNDRPGIVREVSAVLNRHGLSIESMNTRTLDAPMVGGKLFEADVVARFPDPDSVAAVRDDLEQLAAEILVEISLTEAG